MPLQPIRFSIGPIVGGGGGGSQNALLLESGTLDYLLLESGDALLLEG